MIKPYEQWTVVRILLWTIEICTCFVIPKYVSIVHPNEEYRMHSIWLILNIVIGLPIIIVAGSSLAGILQLCSLIDILLYCCISDILVSIGICAIKGIFDEEAPMPILFTSISLMYINIMCSFLDIIFLLQSFLL